MLAGGIWDDRAVRTYDLDTANARIAEIRPLLVALRADRALVAEEKAALASRKRPIVRSQWVEATRPLERLAPIPPEEYALRPGDAPDDHDGH